MTTTTTYENAQGNVGVNSDMTLQYVNIKMIAMGRDRLSTVEGVMELATQLREMGELLNIALDVISKKLPTYMIPMNPLSKEQQQELERKTVVLVKDGTVGWYLDRLPEPARAAAMTNANKRGSLNAFCNSIEEALVSFDWTTSPEGRDYWQEVFNENVPF